MKFSEQFKNSSVKNTISDLVKKHQPSDIKKMSQTDMIKTLEQEKANEKNKEICENYDLIIAAIKAWFAKKFDQVKAQNTIMQKAKDAVLAKRALQIVEQNKDLEQFAKSVLGAQFIENIKKSNAYTKSINPQWQKQL